MYRHILLNLLIPLLNAHPLKLTLLAPFELTQRDTVVEHLITARVSTIEAYTCTDVECIEKYSNNELFRLQAGMRMHATKVAFLKSLSVSYPPFTGVLITSTTPKLEHEKTEFIALYRNPADIASHIPPIDLTTTTPRYAPPPGDDAPTSPVHLAGYTARLKLKSTEYVAQDEVKTSSTASETLTAQPEFSKSPHFGFQVAKHINGSFDRMKDVLGGNWHTVPDEKIDDIQIQRAREALWVNGVEVHGVYEALAQMDADMAQPFTKLLPPAIARRLMNPERVSSNTCTDWPFEMVKIMPNDPIVYLNNLRLRKDWSKNARQLFYSRGIPPIAHNIFTIILVLKYNESDLKILADLQANISQMTLRFGFIFLDAPAAISKALLQLNKDGLTKAISALSEDPSGDISDLPATYGKSIPDTVSLSEVTDFIDRYHLKNRTLIVNGLLQDMGNGGWQESLGNPLNFMIQHAKETLMRGGDVVWEQYWRNMGCAQSRINPVLQVPQPASNCTSTLSGNNFGSAYGKQAEQYTEFLRSLNVTVDLCQLKVPDDRSIIAFNGRTFGPFDAVWTEEDFKALIDKFGTEASIKQILDDVSPELHHVVATNPIPEQDRESIDPQTISFTNEADSAICVTVSMNPVSDFAIKHAGFVYALSKLAIRVEVILMPQEGIIEPPGYAQYVTGNSTLDTAGAFEPAIATFDAIPTMPLFTVHLDVPSSWVVQAHETDADLDNLRLATLPSPLPTISYALTHILLQGHAQEPKTRNPPAGVEFVLSNDAYATDTIVMSNLGYLQLKSVPGSFILDIRPGRSKDVYRLRDGAMTIQIDSLTGPTIYPIVERRPGMETAELSEPESPKPKSWLETFRIADYFGKAEKAEPELETINVFSVASGHLYERFLRIMILSVLKNTKSPVHFWFLESFLSPSFKSFLPILKAEYNIEVSLITYKWPDWLRQQDVKQRVIWGYKILFLDVLFPLDVKKIIFVDADQIVRADLKELIDMDLEGAPYGYTPFCNDRPEMDGFRFWKSGYWKDHLQGRPYHISALYVVDLVRFRELSAGDRLRGQYQSLSMDPNSLANLDQDLPNNMIHQVPIHSLPQEWLYCETWCAKENLARAKTIDMCNDPMTKEPKLQRARRMVPEWNIFDKEIQDLHQRWKDGELGNATVPQEGGDVAKEDGRKDEL